MEGSGREDVDVVVRREEMRRLESIFGFGEREVGWNETLGS